MGRLARGINVTRARGSVRQRSGMEMQTTRANPGKGIQGETDCDIPIGTIVASDVKASDPPFGAGKIYSMTCVPQPNDLGKTIAGPFFSPH